MMQTASRPDDDRIAADKPPEANAAKLVHARIRTDTARSAIPTCAGERRAFAMMIVPELAIVGDAPAPSAGLPSPIRVTPPPPSAAMHG
jgi:hypothetical protein